MLSCDIDVQILGDPHDPGAAGGVRDASDGDHVDLHGKINGSCQIGEEEEGALENS